MLAACPLFERLAPAVLVQLAERSYTTELSSGETRTTETTVWVVARGALSVVERDTASSVAPRRDVRASAGRAIGMVRVVRPTTPIVEVVAEQPTTLVGVGIDDVRDVLEEDTNALAALAGRLADLSIGDET